MGVLEALESLPLHVDCIAGTSAGSYVATLYAHGVKPKEMMEMIKQFPGPRLLDYGFPLWSSLFTLVTRRLWPARKPFDLPAGLLRGRQLQKYFQKNLRTRESQIPYYIIATDLYTGSPVVYGHPANVAGKPEAPRDRSQKDAPWRHVEPITDLARVIRGSCSLPGIFTPVVIGERLLVDGGLRSYVPVEILRAHGCTHILAVNLYHLEDHWEPETFAHVLSRSFDIILDETIDGDIEGTDVFSIAPDVSHISWLSFNDMLESVDNGRKSVLNKKRDLEVFLESTHSAAFEESKRTGRHSFPVLKIQASSGK